MDSSESSSGRRRSTFSTHVLDGRPCVCGASVKVYTSWTKDNPGRRFLRCHVTKGERCRYFEWVDPPMCDRSRIIIPGLLSRVNHAQAENTRLEHETMTMNTEMQRLVNSITKLENENMALRRKLKFAMICAMVLFICFLFGKF
ncbi:hypothetical protein ACJIZ3_002036 [Penstemon smallii]|uniref:GRF-type domain-containing protein n=1 Tax=Penstemon smallii TaxID=265156 RepID=A0ABD3U828_9LAMI